MTFITNLSLNKKYALHSPFTNSPEISRPTNLGPGSSPGSRILEYRVPVRVLDPVFSDFESRSRVPDFSDFSPSPESCKFWIWVPVPVPEFIMSTGSRPDFRDRARGIPGTLSQMPTPVLNYKFSDVSFTE